MKASIRTLLLSIPLFTMLTGGCATRAIHLKGNRVLVRANGQTIIKGFGDGKAYSVVCTLNPGPYGIERKQQSAVSVDVLKYVEAKVGSETALKTVMLYAQTQQLAALDTIMTQVCVAYGNGAFGEIGSATAADSYFKQIDSLLNKFVSVPNVVLAPNPGSAGTPPPTGAGT